MTEVGVEPTPQADQYMTRAELIEWVKTFGENESGHFLSKEACDDFAAQLAKNLDLLR